MEEIKSVDIDSGIAENVEENEKEDEKIENGENEDGGKEFVDRLGELFAKVDKLHSSQDSVLSQMVQMESKSITIEEIVQSSLEKMAEHTRKDVEKEMKLSPRKTKKTPRKKKRKSSSPTTKDANIDDKKNNFNSPAKKKQSKSKSKTSTYFSVTKDHKKTSSNTPPKMGSRLSNRKKKINVKAKKQRYGIGFNQLLNPKVPEKDFKGMMLSQSLDTIVARNLKITSFKEFGVHPTLKKIYIQDNYLTNFLHFSSHPNLEYLHIGNNNILSLLGFPSLPKLKTIIISGNPICAHPHFRLMLLLVIGNQLKEINGKVIHTVERELSREYMKKYPLSVVCLKLGWLLQFEKDMNINQEFLTQLKNEVILLSGPNRHDLMKSKPYQLLMNVPSWYDKKKDKEFIEELLIHKDVQVVKKITPLSPFMLKKKKHSSPSSLKKKKNENEQKKEEVKEEVKEEEDPEKKRRTFEFNELRSISSFCFEDIILTIDEENESCRLLIHPSSPNSSYFEIELKDFNFEKERNMKKRKYFSDDLESFEYCSKTGILNINNGELKFFSDDLIKIQMIQKLIHLFIYQKEDEEEKEKEKENGEEKEEEEEKEKEEKEVGKELFVSESFGVKDFEKEDDEEEEGERKFLENEQEKLEEKEQKIQEEMEKMEEIDSLSFDSEEKEMNKLLNQIEKEKNDEQEQEQNVFHIGIERLENRFVLTFYDSYLTLMSEGEKEEEEEDHQFIQFGDVLSLDIVKDEEEHLNTYIVETEKDDADDEEEKEIQKWILSVKDEKEIQMAKKFEERLNQALEEESEESQEEDEDEEDEK